MTSFGNLYPGSGSGGSTMPEIMGNGHLVYNEGQIVGRSLIGVAPLLIEHPDGIGGATVFRAQPQSMLLGSLIGANGAITADQPFEIHGADSYVVRRVIIANASAEPTTTIKGGIYTAASKGGTVIVPAAQGYDALDPEDEFKIIDIPISLARAHRAPQLYLSLTTAEATPLTFDVYVFGDAMKGIPA